LIIGSHSCTEPKKLAKVGREDFEITDLTGVVKNKKQKQNTAQQPGGLKSKACNLTAASIAAAHGPGMRTITAGTTDS